MNKRTSVYIGIVILALLAIAIIIKTDNNSSTPETQTSNQIGTQPQTTETAATIEASGTESAGVAKTSKKEAGLTYQQVVEKYLKARIEFNDQCHAKPATGTTFKNGTSVMFDNRSAEGRVISLDGKGYTISQYGFIILPLSSKTLPHTIKIDCDKQYNTANILIQK